LKKIERKHESFEFFLFFRTHALEGKVDNQDDVPQSAFLQRKKVELHDCKEVESLEGL